MTNVARREGRAWLLALALVLCIAPAGANGDPLTPYRSRFQQGLDRYRAGDVLGAIQYWEPIRRELGDEQAFRLLYNLGRAYEEVGDATLAAEHYERFLAFARDKGTSERLDAVVQENQKDAEARLEGLRVTRARIRVLTSDRPGLVQIDRGQPRWGAFVAYLAPGKHTVTVDAGTSQERKTEVNLAAGQEWVVDPTREVSPPAAEVPALPRPSTAPATAPGRPETGPTLGPSGQRPFSPAVLAVSGAVTAATFVVPWLAYGNAKGIADEYGRSSTSVARRRELVADYDDARRTYHLSWTVPGVAAAATAGLTVWFFAGTHEPPLVTGGVLPNGGAWARATGSF